MPEPIVPVAEIPLASNLNGSVSMPALDFSPDGTLLYVRQPVERLSTWEYAAWYAPDVAAVALPIALVLGLILLRRVLRSPREHGKVYCRKCNYALTPPLVERSASGSVIAREGDRCPECGSLLARVRPVIGRSSAVRLWPVWGAAAPLILVCVVTLVLTLQAWAPMGMNAMWPWPGAQATLARMGLGSLALQKRYRPRQLGDRTNRITRYALPSGQRVGSVWDVETHGFNNGRLAAGGSVYLTIVQDPGNSAISLLSIDAQTSEQRRVMLTPWTGGADILGVSPDGETVYVQVVTSSRQSAGASGPWTSTVSLRAVNPRTLEGTEIASLDRSLQQGSRGWETPYHKYVINTNADPLQWALVSCYVGSSGAPSRADIVHFDGKERQEYVVPAAGTGWHEPKLINGGATLEVNHYGMPMPPATRLDLATGTQTAAPSSLVISRGESPDGRWWIVAGAKYLEIVDMRSGSAVACTNAPAASGTGVVSADGRRVACIMWGGLGGASLAPVVAVWEIPKQESADEGTKPPTP